MKNKIVVLCIALLSGLSSISFGNTFEEMSVLDVQNEGAMLLGKKVEVTGTIAYYTRVPGGNAGLYQIRGPYNGQIDVKTVSGEPELNQVYRIQGTIEIDEQQSVFIYEANRMPVNDGGPPPPPIEEPPYLAIILIAAGVIVFVTIIAVILILVRRNKQPAIPPMPAESMVPPVGAPASESSAAAADFEDVEVTIRRDQVVVNTDDTVRYWPAHLEVIKGSAASGQKIPLCAPGNHVIIGRRKPGKSQGADFIGLEDTSRALSGEQCRISQKNGKFVLSYAKSGVPNPSKVNGVELHDGQEQELTDGAEVCFPADPEYVLRFRTGRFIPGS